MGGRTFASRRAFLAGVGGLSLAAIGCRGSSDTREAALSGTVARVLVPDARAIATSSAALEASLQQLSAANAEPPLAQARLAWRGAALAWQRGFAFQHGPYIETRALLRAAYWPVSPDAIEQLLRGDAPIDAARVAALGVNVKGLYALEQLLFTTDPSGAAWPLGSLRPRVLALLQACAEHVRGYAERIHDGLRDETKFAREFGRGGQASIDRVVNGLLETVELAVIRIQRVLSIPASRGVLAQDVQGGPSGTSTDVLTTWLAVCERVYGTRDIPSLASLVHAVAPPIHEHVRAAFATARAALASLGQPLEHAARPQLTAAQQALRQLEVSLRSELASALGVTITFSSHDGD